MIRPITIESIIHFERQGRGFRKEIRQGKSPAPTERPSGRIPRMARFMALAIRFEQLIRDGQVSDYAELARLGHVTANGTSSASSATSHAGDSGRSASGRSSSSPGANWYSFPGQKIQVFDHYREVIALSSQQGPQPTAISQAGPRAGSLGKQRGSW